MSLIYSLYFSTTRWLFFLLLVREFCIKIFVIGSWLIPIYFLAFLLCNVYRVYVHSTYIPWIFQQVAVSKFISWACFCHVLRSYLTLNQSWSVFLLATLFTFTLPNTSKSTQFDIRSLPGIATTFLVFLTCYMIFDYWWK